MLKPRADPLLHLATIEPRGKLLHPHHRWRWRLNRNTLVIALPARYRVLSWAPLGGGLGRARVILNHQIARDNRAATESPAAYLSRLARSLGFSPADTVAMMTGANVARAGVATLRRGELLVSAWCSAGCSNALRAGDRASAVTHSIGTINLAVAVNREMTVAALVEALELAVEARVLAVQQAGVLSVRSGEPATGTGTDCVVVATPAGRDARAGAITYCGKHTLLGEMLARVVLKSCAAALHRRTEPAIAVAGGKKAQRQNFLKVPPRRATDTRLSLPRARGIH